MEHVYFVCLLPIVWGLIPLAQNIMTTTQITRRKNADNSETLIKHIDGTTLPYSGPNLTTLLSGITNPIFVLKKIHSNGYAYPFTLEARD